MIDRADTIIADHLSTTSMPIRYVTSTQDETGSQGVNMLLLGIQPSGSLQQLPRTGFRSSEPTDSGIAVELTYLVTAEGDAATQHRLLSEFFVAVSNKPVIESGEMKLTMDLAPIPTTALAAIWAGLNCPAKACAIVTVRGLRLTGA